MMQTYLVHSTYETLLAPSFVLLLGQIAIIVASNLPALSQVLPSRCLLRPEPTLEFFALGKVNASFRHFHFHHGCSSYVYSYWPSSDIAAILIVSKTMFAPFHGGFEMHNRTTVSFSSSSSKTSLIVVPLVSSLKPRYFAVTHHHDRASSSSSSSCCHHYQGTASSSPRLEQSALTSSIAAARSESPVAQDTSPPSSPSITVHHRRGSSYTKRSTGTRRIWQCGQTPDLFQTVRILPC